MDTYYKSFEIVGTVALDGSPEPQIFYLIRGGGLDVDLATSRQEARQMIDEIEKEMVA